MTAINSLLAADTTAVVTNRFDGQMLRLGQMGGVLVTPASGGLLLGATANDGFLTAGGAANTAGELALINNSLTAPLTVNASIVSNGSGLVTVTVNGPGAVAFNGDNRFNQTFINGGNATFTGNNAITGPTPLAIRAGTVTLAAGSVNAFSNGTLFVDGGGVLNVAGAMLTTNEVRVGATVGSRATMNVGGNFTLGQTRVGLRLGVDAGSAGAVIQTGGVVYITTAGSDNDANFNLGTGDRSYGYYLLTDGELRAQRIQISFGGVGSYGVFDQYGGYAGFTNYVMISRSTGGAGVVNVFGGRFEGGRGQPMAMNWDGRPGFGMLNVGGTGVVNSALATGQPLQLNRTLGGTGVVNVLSGGTLIANQITATQLGVTLFNFDGGTLVAASNTTLSGSFMPNVLMGAVIYDGGANIDSGTNNITIAQPLSGATGYGLTNIAFNDGGIGYIGAPVVLIGGGSGTGATAIAQMDLTPGSPKYQQVTNIFITSAGSGYLPNDALNISLQGGGVVQPAQLGAFSFGANATDGGLTKLGNGNLTLLATNSYAGATVARAGAL